MKRFHVAGLILCASVIMPLAVGAILTPSVAAEVNTPCKKKGQTDGSLVCKKKGTKLMWARAPMVAVPAIADCPTMISVLGTVQADNYFLKEYTKVYFTAVLNNSPSAPQAQAEAFAFANKIAATFTSALNIATADETKALLRSGITYAQQTKTNDIERIRVTIMQNLDMGRC